MPCDCNSACRDKLIAAKDKAQSKVACLGVGEYSTEVKVVTRTWDGVAPGDRAGGTPGYTDTVVTLTPRPKVSEIPPRYRAVEAGKSARGRRLVRNVSLTYAKGDLDDSALAGSRNVERFYLLNNEWYRIDSEPIEAGLGWKFEVTRVQKMPDLNEA